MLDYYCLDISFPGIDFDACEQGYEKVKPIHHAHLYSKESEIEIRIYFEPKTGFDRKFSIWSSSINWRKFGSYLVTTNEAQNERLQRIDLSNSALLGVKNGTAQHEGGLNYALVKIDSLKFYWDPQPEIINTGEFFFNDAGFKVVKGFYAPLFGWDGEFNISRMDKMDEFYRIGKSSFRPEFSFYINDDRSSPEAKIIKEPKIQFKYEEPITETEAIKYADAILLLASFYFHLQIDYGISKIYLEKSTVVIKTIQKKASTESLGNFWAFNLGWNFHKFMKAGWQESTLKNHKRLSVAINLFNQSHLVGGSSGFLIRFNIIELCMGGGKPAQAKFQSILSDKAKEGKYTEALTILLKTIDVNDHELFKKKWQGIIKKLNYKPMNSPLEDFLIEQKLPISKFPISVNRLKKIRDYLTHGSIQSIKQDELETANILLYRISGVLILNLMGIRDWELKTKF